MTTTPKGNPLLSVRIPAELNQLLNEHAASTGEDRSKVAIAALTNYLQPPTVEDELPQLKRRLQKAEAAIQVLQQQVLTGVAVTAR